MQGNRTRWLLIWLASSLVLVLSSGFLALVRWGPISGVEPLTTAETKRSTETLVTNAPTARAQFSATIVGGAFRAGIIGQITTLNPLLARTTAEALISSLVFDRLVWVDGTGLPHPALAREWKASDDERTYTVQLRDDVTWHDGKSFTAQDVLFTIRLIQDITFPGDPTLATFWRSVSVEVIDAHTLRFQLAERYAPFVTYLSVPMLPKHLLEGILPSDLRTSPFSTQPVGTGPYQVEHVDLAQGIIELVRFEETWSSSPNFDRVTIRLFDSADEALSAFRQGKLDGLELVPWAAVRDTRLLGDGVRVYAPLLAGFTALFLNGQAQFFRDVRVRQAIALALNREELVSSILAESAEPGNGPIPPALWAYQAQDYRFDRAAALRLLRDAGWEDRNGDGILEKEGLNFRFNLLVNIDDPERVAVAQAVANQLSEIGIAVTVQPVASQTLQRQLLDRAYTAAIFGWMSLFGDPDMFELWHSSQAELGLNITGFRSQQIDVLLEKARQTQDQKERRSLYVEFQRLFAEFVPAVILYYPRYCFVLRNEIGGVDVEPLIHPEDHIRQLPHWYRIVQSP